MSNKNKYYPPKMREFSEDDVDPSDLVSYSKTGKTFTPLPHPLNDPIVAQNISYQEFDYISDHETHEE